MGNCYLGYMDRLTLTSPLKANSISGVTDAKLPDVAVIVGVHANLEPIHRPPTREVKKEERGLSREYLEAIDFVMKEALPHDRHPNNKNLSKNNYLYSANNLRSIQRLSGLNLERFFTAKLSVDYAYSMFRRRQWKIRFYPWHFSRYDRRHEPVFSFNELRLALIKATLSYNGTPAYIENYREHSRNQEFVRKELKELEKHLSDDELVLVNNVIQRLVRNHKKRMGREVLTTMQELSGIGARYLVYPMLKLSNNTKLGRYFTEEELKLILIEATLAFPSKPPYLVSDYLNYKVDPKLLNDKDSPTLYGVCSRGVALWSKRIKRICSYLEIDPRSLSDKEMFRLVLAADKIDNHTVSESWYIDTDDELKLIAEAFRANGEDILEQAMKHTRGGSCANPIT